MHKLLFCFIFFSCTSEKNDIVKQKPISFEFYSATDMKQIMEFLNCDTSFLPNYAPFVKVENHLNDTIKLWAGSWSGMLFLITHFGEIKNHNGMVIIDYMGPGPHVYRDSLLELPPHSSKIFRSTFYTSKNDDDRCIIVAPDVILPEGIQIDTPINRPLARVGPVYAIYKINNGQFEDCTELMTDSILRYDKEIVVEKR